MPSRYFTLDEANATLAVIRPLIAEVLEIRQRILAMQPEIWPAIARSVGNGGNAQLSLAVKEFDRLDDVVHRILATGVEIKDLSIGLLDFRARRGDAEVYLCWKHGESEIAFWHDLDAGFAGRRPMSGF
jgi:hypothetical protein